MLASNPHWNTYSNKAYGFSFQYPQDRIEEVRQTDNAVVEIVYCGDASDNGWRIFLDVRVRASSERNSVEEYLPDISSIYPSKDVTKEAIKIDGINGYKVTITSDTSQYGLYTHYSYNAFVKRNGYVYEVNFSFPTYKELLANDYLFTQLLFTFKFLD